ncbi:hypothetical protein [Amycolatopsis pigmentata]|uniref:Uncharacterized protein n=1 Tax=Amycolatopsis pigmentata TaxID=450801 RepID=A0ABW5FP17_9PSEU
MERPDRRVPVEIEDGYQLLLAGSTKLTSDGSDVPIYAYHQFKPQSDGLVVKLCALFPATTPNELVDGHSLHLAIEFAATLRFIAATRQISEYRSMRDIEELLS